MPSSPKPNLAFIITLQICGVATASAQHDNYQSKLDELAKSPDPELSDGLLFNEVFSLEINDAFTNMRHASTSFKYYTNVSTAFLCTLQLSLCELLLFQPIKCN